MQTFLPFLNFEKSLLILDVRRCGKQRVETFQILNTLLGRTQTKGWKNHPASLMWKGYENALKEYFNLNLDIWIAKGYNNTMKKEIIEGDILYPSWLGNQKFHDSHKSNLYKKDPIHYKIFEDIGPDLPYFWPTKEGF